MSPCAVTYQSITDSAPRASGDEPRRPNHLGNHNLCSPRERG